MLFKIKRNPLHLLSGALPLLYVPGRLIGGALVARLPVGPLGTVESLFLSQCLFGTI